MEMVYEHLKRKAGELKLDLTLHSEKLVIIDCYTKLASQVMPKGGERNRNNHYTILEVNPRKPQKLNEKYGEALRILKQRECDGFV